METSSPFLHFILSLFILYLRFQSAEHLPSIYTEIFSLERSLLCHSGKSFYLAIFRWLHFCFLTVVKLFLTYGAKAIKILASLVSLNSTSNKFELFKMIFPFQEKIRMICKIMRNNFIKAD